MDDGPRANAARVLVACKAEILRRWEQGVRREVKEPTPPQRAVLLDSLPEFLDNLAETLAPDHPRRTAVEGTTIPRQHGGERVRVTSFRLADVIREYHVLRDVLLEVLGEQRALDEEVRELLVRSLDRAVLEASSAYLVAWDALRERITMTLAHDVRSPLGAAKISVALILKQPDHPQVRRWAARADASLDRADRMIRSLLDVSRAGSGAGLTLDLQRGDLRELVRQVIEALGLANDRVILDVPEPVFGWWDSEALGRALENLLANAVKYGAPGAPVTVRLDRQDERAVISVHNEGSYIPPERRDELFQLYRRGAASGTAGRGWGLGLALVRAVAEAHGGAINVDSLPGTGTTFRLTLATDARPAPA